MQTFCYLIAIVLASALLTSARHVNHNKLKPTDSDISVTQPRVLPGAVAVTKLVLLKFKKIIPISLILLRSSNEDEAELLPVYPTSEIPANAEFIPTPNGISGHKDVQAIAIPSEFHHELELQGLGNLDGIESLLNQAAENESENESSVNGNASTNEGADELLNVKEDDEDQLLERAVVETPKKRKSGGSTTRRLTSDGAKSPLRAQTTIEEIPIYLYAVNDSAHVIKHQIGAQRYRQKT